MPSLFDDLRDFGLEAVDSCKSVLKFDSMAAAMHNETSCAYLARATASTFFGINLLLCSVAGRFDLGRI